MVGDGVVPLDQPLVAIIDPHSEAASFAAPHELDIVCCLSISSWIVVVIWKFAKKLLIATDRVKNMREFKSSKSEYIGLSASGVLTNFLETQEN